jgi:hypothetical protein
MGARRYNSDLNTPIDAGLREAALTHVTGVAVST